MMSRMMFKFVVISYVASVSVNIADLLMHTRKALSRDCSQMITSFSAYPQHQSSSSTDNSCGSVKRPTEAIQVDDGMLQASIPHHPARRLGSRQLIGGNHRSENGLVFYGRNDLH